MPVWVDHTLVWPRVQLGVLSLVVHRVLGMEGNVIAVWLYAGSMNFPILGVALIYVSICPSVGRLCKGRSRPTRSSFSKGSLSIATLYGLTGSNESPFLVRSIALVGYLRRRGIGTVCVFIQPLTVREREAVEHVVVALDTVTGC